MIRNLEKLNTQIADGAHEARLRAGFEVEREAVAEVPVRSSRLKSSISTQEVGDIVEAGSGVKAGSEVEYAHYVEYGTSRQRAHPYMQPAVEIVRQKYPNMIINDVQKEMK